VVDARYDVAREVVELTLRSGDLRAVRRRRIPELNSATASELRRITVSPAGDVVAWRELDVDVSARALLALARSASQRERATR
jgi:hypothetical protein